VDEHQIEYEMRINLHACIGVAEEEGHNKEQAENCNEGDLDCKNCPWGGKYHGNR